MRRRRPQKLGAKIMNLDHPAGNPKKRPKFLSTGARRR